MAIREGAWDCTCGENHIKARHLKCPKCGDPRNPLLDPEEATYLPDGASVVTDEEGLRIARSGPVWNCGHCGMANLGTTNVCSDCGEPKGPNDDVVPVRNYLDKPDDGVPLSTPDDLMGDRVSAILQQADPLQALESSPVVQPERTLLTRFLPRRSPNEDVRLGSPSQNVLSYLRSVFAATGWLRLLMVGVAIFMLIIGGMWIHGNYFKTTPVDLTVTELRWERQVEIEVFKTLTLEDWDYPSDARVLSSRTEIRSYRQVIDRYETRTRQVSERVLTGYRSESYTCGHRDNGNGFYEDIECTRQVPEYETRYRTETYQEPIYRSEPVYDTKYRYEVDRWVTERFAVASGDVDPYWPVPETLPAKRRVGDERIQKYTVKLLDPKARIFSREIDEKTWRYLQVEEVVRGHQTRKGSIRRIEWPKQ